EQVAGLSAEEAKRELIRGIENEAKLDAARIIQRIETEANEVGQQRARKILGMAIQRMASDYVAENTVSVVALPSEDMKGRLLGRLRYRTAYGQNVLVHSREVAQLAALMAVELGVNDTIAKRGGLLHHIGKAIDREMEGTHLELGRQVLEKYGEKRDVIHDMECHHGDYDPTTVEAVLVNAADALSAARPGAR